MSDQQQTALREYLLAFADDEHFMGQQHTEWIGVAPFLEEDLAFSSIGQDELGHAAMLYELVLDLDFLDGFISFSRRDDLAIQQNHHVRVAGCKSKTNPRGG